MSDLGEIKLEEVEDLGEVQLEDVADLGEVVAPQEAVLPPGLPQPSLKGDIPSEVLPQVIPKEDPAWLQTLESISKSIGDITPRTPINSVAEAAARYLRSGGDSAEYDEMREQDFIAAQQRTARSPYSTLVADTMGAMTLPGGIIANSAAEGVGTYLETEDPAQAATSAGAGLAAGGILKGAGALASKAIPTAEKIKQKAVRNFSNYFGITPKQAGSADFEPWVGDVLDTLSKEGLNKPSAKEVRDFAINQQSVKGQKLGNIREGTNTGINRKELLGILQEKFTQQNERMSASGSADTKKAIKAVMPETYHKMAKELDTTIKKLGETKDGSQKFNELSGKIDKLKEQMGVIEQEPVDLQQIYNLKDAQKHGTGTRKFFQDVEDDMVSSVGSNEALAPLKRDYGNAVELEKASQKAVGEDLLGRKPTPIQWINKYNIIKQVYHKLTGNPANLKAIQINEKAKILQNNKWREVLAKSLEEGGVEKLSRTVMILNRRDKEFRQQYLQDMKDAAEQDSNNEE